MAKKSLSLTGDKKLPALKPSYSDRSKYPWLDIRTDYVEGYEDSEGTWVWPTITNLAEKYNAPDAEAQIANRAAKERWMDHRKAHQAQIAIERQAAHAKMLAEKAVKFDADAVETAVFANQLIDQRLHELLELKGIMDENRQLLIDEVKAGNFVTPGQLKASAISGAELESLSKAFALFNETGRKALGIKEGESAINLTVNNTEVNQVSIKEELRKTDTDRATAIARLFQNSNFSLSQISGVVNDQQAAIEAGDTVEGEIVNE